MGQSQSKRMDKYVATYERAFERIETDLQRVLQRRERGRRARAALSLWSAVAVVASAVVGAWLVQQVQRQAPGTYTVGEHAARTSAALALPFAVAAVRWLLLLLLGAADARASSHAAKLDAAKRTLVRELKDACRFDTARRLLARYDPDERKQQQHLQHQQQLQQQQQQQLQQQRRRAAAAAAATGAGQHRNPQQHQHQQQHRQQQSPQLLATAGAAAASAVAGAGRAVLPLIDRLATTLIADNPVLLEDIRQARAALAEAGSEAAAAARENEALRTRVLELERALAIAEGRELLLPEEEGLAVEGGEGGELAGEPEAAPAEAEEEEEEEGDDEAEVAAAAAGGKCGAEPGDAAAAPTTVEVAATAAGGGVRQRRRNGARANQ
jgi:hypothetical protein